MLASSRWCRRRARPRARRGGAFDLAWRLLAHRGGAPTAAPTGTASRSPQLRLARGPAAAPSRRAVGPSCASRFRSHARRARAEPGRRSRRNGWSGRESVLQPGRRDLGAWRSECSRRSPRCIALGNSSWRSKRACRVRLLERHDVHRGHRSIRIERPGEDAIAEFVALHDRVYASRSAHWTPRRCIADAARPDRRSRRSASCSPSSRARAARSWRGLRGVDHPYLRHWNDGSGTS